MMRTITFFVFLFSLVFAHAQDKRVVIEKFENNDLRWDEFFEKEYTGSVQDGFFVLQSKKEGTVLHSVTELPLDTEQSFKITFTFMLPKIDDKFFFGIIFNYQDESNYSNFLVSEKRCKIGNIAGGKNSLSRQNPIVLKSGKNREVVIEMEKKGDKLFFSVDNMEAAIITKKIISNTFGFQVEDANILKVKEVTMEQYNK